MRPDVKGVDKIPNTVPTPSVVFEIPSSVTLAAWDLIIYVHAHVHPTSSSSVTILIILIILQRPAFLAFDVRPAGNHTT